MKEKSSLIVDSFVEEYGEYGKVFSGSRWDAKLGTFSRGWAKCEEHLKLQKLVDSIVEWSSATFGDRQLTAVPVCHHLIKEANELIDALEKGEEYKEEFADCFMLLLESANTCGISADELIELTYQKLEKNKLRKWGKPDEHGVIEHVDEATNEQR